MQNKINCHIQVVKCEFSVTDMPEKRKIRRENSITFNSKPQNRLQSINGLIDEKDK